MMAGPYAPRETHALIAAAEGMLRMEEAQQSPATIGDQEDSESRSVRAIHHCVVSRGDHACQVV